MDNDYTVVDGVNVLGIENKPFCSGGCNNAVNVNVFNKDTELYKLTDKAMDMMQDK